MVADKKTPDKILQEIVFVVFMYGFGAIVFQSVIKLHYLHIWG